MALLCVFTFQVVRFLPEYLQFLVYRLHTHFIKLILMSYLDSIVMLFMILFLMFLFSISHAVNCYVVLPHAATLFELKVTSGAFVVDKLGLSRPFYLNNDSFAFSEFTFNFHLFLF